MNVTEGLSGGGIKRERREKGKYTGGEREQECNTCICLKTA
jgi:hypothetical protein